MYNTVVCFQVQNDVPKSNKPKSASPKQEKVASPKQEKAKPKSPQPVKEPVKSKSPELSAPKEKKTLAPIRASAGSQAASDWMKSAREENVNKSDAPSSSGAQVCSFYIVCVYVVPGKFS